MYLAAKVRISLVTKLRTESVLALEAKVASRTVAHLVSGRLFVSSDFQAEAVDIICDNCTLIH